MSTPLRALILEDFSYDAELMVAELGNAGYAVEWKRVENESGFREMLEAGSWEVILGDFQMPGFDAMKALQVLQERGQDIPFLLVSGTIGEEGAVSIMRQGAADYVMKDRMARLGQAVEQALEKKRLRDEGKEIAKSLHENEERFRATFEQAAVGMAHILPDGSWLRVNRKLCNILGYGREELLAHPFLEFPHPDDREVVAGAMRQLLEGRKETATVEKRYKHGDGSWQWARATLSLVRGHSGEPQYFILVIEDITERKMAEKQILEQASLIDLANDAIMVCSIEDQIGFWNKRAESLYGWRYNDVIGRKTTEFLYPGAREFERARREVLEHGSWMGELAQVSKEGKELVVDARWTLLRDENGEPKSILAINTDITDKKKLEEQFLRAQRLESIGTLASGVAHDLNNILAPILMSAAMLREDISKELRDSIIQTVEESAQRGSEIVKQVLTFARGVRGDHIILQPRHLIREVEKIMTETFPKSISIINRVPRELRTVAGDPTQLHQVLLNLCINARDAMPEGGSLIIGAEEKEVDEAYAAVFPNAKPGAYVALTVEDTGTGIPPGIADKIFDPFFTTKEQGKGTGLGLSTAIGIVKSHGGFINLESHVGKGTRFKVFLPAGNKPLPAAQTADASQIPIGNGEIILAVDDEAEIRTVLETVLSRNGYQVIVAADGNDALKKFALQAGAVKLVLTDVMMPVADGMALMRALKKMEPNIKVIATTGQSERSRLEELKALGAKALLRKPFNREKLLKKVAGVLEGKYFESDFQP